MIRVIHWIRRNLVIVIVGVITMGLFVNTVMKYIEFQQVREKYSLNFSPTALEQYSEANDAAGFSIIALLAWCVLIAAITTAWAVWRAGQDPEEDLDDPDPNTPMNAAPRDERSRAA